MNAPERLATSKYALVPLIDILGSEAGEKIYWDVVETVFIHSVMFFKYSL